jgi:hypothetical protein
MQLLFILKAYSRERFKTVVKILPLTSILKKYKILEQAIFAHISLTTKL